MLKCYRLKINNYQLKVKILVTKTLKGFNKSIKKRKEKRKRIS